MSFGRIQAKGGTPFYIQIGAEVVAKVVFPGGFKIPQALASTIEQALLAKWPDVSYVKRDCGSRFTGLYKNRFRYGPGEERVAVYVQSRFREDMKEIFANACANFRKNPPTVDPGAEDEVPENIHDASSIRVLFDGEFCRIAGWHFLSEIQRSAIIHRLQEEKMICTADDRSQVLGKINACNIPNTGQKVRVSGEFREKVLSICKEVLDLNKRQRPQSIHGEEYSPERSSSSMSYDPPDLFASDCDFDADPEGAPPPSGKGPITAEDRWAELQMWLLRGVGVEDLFEHDS